LQNIFNSDKSISRKVITDILPVVLVIIEKAEFKKFTAGGDIFRAGIISDTQLPPNEKSLKKTIYMSAISEPRLKN